MTLAVLCAAPAVAQGDPRTTRNISIPVPSQLELSQLVWSTMAAVHHANISGNYSVLRDIGATDFQVQNSAAQLAETFRYLRDEQVDLSNTLLLAPDFTIPPAMVAQNIMHLQGFFGLRPIATRFDLYFQWSNGQWKIYGIGIQPVSLSSIEASEGE